MITQHSCQNIVYYFDRFNLKTVVTWYHDKVHNNFHINSWCDQYILNRPSLLHLALTFRSKRKVKVHYLHRSRFFSCKISNIFLQIRDLKYLMIAKKTQMKDLFNYIGRRLFSGWRNHEITDHFSTFSIHTDMMIAPAFPRFKFAEVQS